MANIQERRAKLVEELEATGERLFELARECDAIGGGDYLTLTVFAKRGHVWFNNDPENRDFHMSGHSYDGGDNWEERF